MGDLKRVCDIIYGPNIAVHFHVAVHSSNNLSWRPPTPECEKRVKGAWPGSRDPVKFLVLNVNGSKMAEDTNFKFCRHAPRDSRDMTRQMFRKSGRGQGHVTP